MLKFHLATPDKLCVKSPPPTSLILQQIDHQTPTPIPNSDLISASKDMSEEIGTTVDRVLKGF